MTTPAYVTADQLDVGADDDPYAWMQQGACTAADPEVFFPPPGHGSADAARALCGRCPVRDTCLEYALEEEFDVGVFAGLTPAERRKLGRSAAA